QVVDLLAEPEEVARVERRLDLDLADPSFPGHAGILRTAEAGDEESGRAMHVREGEQELRAPRMPEVRIFGSQIVSAQAELVDDVLVLGLVDRADRVRDRSPRSG